MESTGIQGGNPVLQKYGYMNPVSLKEDDAENMFLQLLVTQLGNQNPLEPMENNEFVQQMSALAAVQETQNLNANIQGLIALQEIMAGQNAFTQSAALVGKHVEYVDVESGDTKSGYVQSIHLKEGGLFLNIGGQDVPMASVTGIVADPAAGGGDAAGETGDETNEDSDAA